MCARRPPRLWLGPGTNWRGGCRERILRGNRFNPLRCTPHVVAVKTESTLHIELGIERRTENQTRFGAGQELVGRAGIEFCEVDHRGARQRRQNVNQASILATVSLDS